MPCLFAGFAGKLDVSVCRSWWLRRLHPAGPLCPQCHTSPSGRQAETWADDGRVWCRSCGRWYNNRSGTLLEACKLDWRKLFALAVLISADLPVVKIASMTGIAESTVHEWQRRFRGAA